MIVVEFFRIMGRVTGVIARLVPDIGLSFDAAYEVFGDDRVWSYWQWANHYLPLDLALVLLTARFVLWGALHGIDAVVWIATKAHVLGGSS